MNDLPQTFMEPILFKAACSRGTQARMSTAYTSHMQDADGVTTTCRDRLSGEDFTVRSKFLVGADGGNSLVAEHLGLPFDGKMGVGGSMNILFRADLSKYVAHRPSVLYWVMQPGADVGGIGMGLVRMVRPWNEWLIVWGYDINQPPPSVTAELATEVARQLVGDPELEIELLGANTWTVNNCFATEMQKGRVFIMGDAAHRHPPSNGLGSNTSIQDGFNLAWKLAKVVKGQAGLPLLDSYSSERAPIARQIVTRANQSIAEFGPIFETLGMDGGVDHDKIHKNMEARADATPGAAAQREALRKAIAFKKYEFDAHGVEMNQRYVSRAVISDGQPQPAFDKDHELHYAPTTWPGARLPHVWVYERSGRKVSTLDLCGLARVHAADRNWRRGVGLGRRKSERGAGPADPHARDRSAPRDRGPYRRLGPGAEIHDTGCLICGPIITSHGVPDGRRRPRPNCAVCSIPSRALRLRHDRPTRIRVFH
jgi:2,4-dichlorophenol 6-monooxygenase